MVLLMESTELLSQLLLIEWKHYLSPSQRQNLTLTDTDLSFPLVKHRSPLVVGVLSETGGKEGVRGTSFIGWMGGERSGNPVRLAPESSICFNLSLPARSRWSRVEWSGDRLQYGSHSWGRLSRCRIMFWPMKVPKPADSRPFEVSSLLCGFELTLRRCYTEPKKWKIFSWDPKAPTHLSLTTKKKNPRMQNNHTEM